MSTADSKDGATADEADATDAMAPTLDSGARPHAKADVGADTELAPAGHGSAAGSGARSGGSAPTGGAANSPDEIIGTILNDRYEVTAKIGQGGMGAVYEARHTLIGKRVALKVLLDKHAEKEQVVARLKQEARLASSIGHDNIIDITDFGTTNTGRTFVVMEFLEGESLGACIARQGRIEPARIVAIATQIASALHAAHEKGIVHRDIKPDNIFLIKRGGTDFVKVVDFGISKSMLPEESDDVRLTQTGMVLGTPLYMSPEQAQGEDDLDHRIDIYALGVILYEAVTGEVPFRGKNYLNILTQVIGDEPTRPSELVADIDHDLESVILKAMAKERDQRYQTMGAFLEDLQALADPDVKSTGARITAARWRKKRERRSKSRYAAWIAGVVAVGGASALAVTMLMGGEAASKSRQRADAERLQAQNAKPSKAVVPADAAVKEPAFVRAKIRLESTPPGALVYRDLRLVCEEPTPCDYLPAMTGEQIELRVELDGYQTGVLHVTPEFDDGQTARIKLEKVVEDVEDTRPHRNHGGRNTGTSEGKDTDTGRDTGKGGSTDTGDSGQGSIDVIPNPHRGPRE